MLMAFPGKADVNKALTNAKVTDAKVKKHERITICGNQPADFVQAEGTTGTSVSIGMGAGQSMKNNSNVDVLVTVANGKTYIALYAWPLNASADPKPKPQCAASVRNKDRRWRRFFANSSLDNHLPGLRPTTISRG